MRGIGGGLLRHCNSMVRRCTESAISTSCPVASRYRGSLPAKKFDLLCLASKCLAVRDKTVPCLTIAAIKKLSLSTPRS